MNRELSMAIAGRLRLRRTRHDPPIGRGIERHRSHLPGAAGSASAPLCRVAPGSSAGFLHAGFCLHELGKTAEAKRLLLKGPVTLLKEPIYYYNMGCYDALLGNVHAAQMHLQTSFKMDASFRGLAKKDPDLKAVQAAAVML